MSDDPTETRKNLPAASRGLIAHARNDITIPRFTTVMSPLDDTLIQRGGGAGLKIYDEIERDTFAYAVLQKRKFALIGREWAVEPATGSALDRKAADFVEEVLDAIEFDQLCLDLLDATLKGFAVAETVWRRDGARIVPESIIAHEQRRFAFDEAWSPRLLTFEAPLHGVALPDRKFVVHRFGVKGNNPFGLGLGSKLFWPVLFKREGVAFWLTFLEKFASPTPIGEYPHGTLPADQNKLLSNLQDMVQSGALVVPMGTKVSFLEATRAGQASYEDWCAYWDTQMALCVFGSSLATQIVGQGSRAASETHKETEEQIVDADADILRGTLSRTLIRWLIDYNMPGAGVPTVGRPRPENQSEAEDLRAKRAANAKSDLDLLFDLAGRVPPERFVETARALAGAGLMPELPDATLRAIGAGVGERPGANAPTRSAETAAFAEGHDHGLEALARQLGVAAEPAIGAWTGRIGRELDAAIAAGEDLARFSERLLAIDPELGLDPLGQGLADALALAELTGRADVQDEIAAKRRRRR